jgi:hypothetical protein
MLPRIKLPPAVISKLDSQAEPLDEMQFLLSAQYIPPVIIGSEQRAGVIPATENFKGAIDYAAIKKTTKSIQ